ncbi:MAG: hypothetical protein ACTSPB_01280 [Candidatus Thorarchaeota archaeon]
MLKTGNPCKKCGSTNTVVCVGGFAMSVSGSGTSPKLTAVLTCFDCGEKESESIDSDKVREEEI